jgi:hypothetical protein
MSDGLFSVILAVALCSNSLAWAEEKELGFTAAHGNPSASMNPEQVCNFSITYRAYWIDLNDKSSQPREIGEKLIRAGAAITALSGWTLDGRAILAVGYYLDSEARCKGTKNPYPFVYESCVCKLDSNDPCDCPTEKSKWGTNPANHKIGMNQVPADPEHYYFAAGHMSSSGCPDCYRLFRIRLDGSDLFQVEGAIAHGVAVSPVNRGIYALDGVGGIAPRHTCVVIRKDQASEYFTDCGGPGKNVYARWSPDGTRLAFARGSGDPFQLSVALWNADPNQIRTKDLVNAADFAANISHNSSLITWSSDSRWIYFSAYGRDSHNIVRVQILKDGSGGRREQLTKGRLDGHPQKAYPAPSPSGRYVAFTAGSDTGPWQLYLVDLRHLDLEPRPLLSGSWIGSDAFVSYPVWRP